MSERTMIITIQLVVLRHDYWMKQQRESFWTHIEKKDFPRDEATIALRAGDSHSSVVQD